MLERFGEGVWIVTRPVKFLGVETGSRMTVVQTAEGGLWVHSPVALDPILRGALDELGEVRAVVAPSLFHHLYVAEWMAAYPNAVFGACPGLEWKRTDLAFTCVVADQPHPAWSSDLEQVYFSSRRENEVVFFHERSRTLICADALLNLSVHPSLSTRAVAKLIGNSAPGVGHLEKYMIRDRKLARRQSDRIQGWGFDRAVVSHGGLVQKDAGDVWRHAYAWLLSGVVRLVMGRAPPSVQALGR
jgi:hypothetical protein